MQVAICIQNQKTAGELLGLFEKYQSQYSRPFSSRSFLTDTDLIVSLTGGEYDAIFFDSMAPERIVEEIREKDTQVLLIQLIPFESDAKSCEGIWYCLAEPFCEAFVFPLLDRLFEETSHREESGLLIRCKHSVTYLLFSHIFYIEVIGKTVYFHLKNGTVLDVIGTFSDFESRLLCWPDFIKVHRSYIVNLRYVERMESGSILLHDGSMIPVSRRLYPQLKKEWLSQLMSPVETPENTYTASDTAAPSQAVSVLLIDDSMDDRSRFSRLLKEHGCRVITADTKETALLKAAERHFDCVVLDVQLGETMGFDLCASIQKLTDAPVIYLSVLSDSESQTRGFLTGGVDYITKGLPDDLIWLKLKTRIEISRTERAELSQGSLVLNLKTRQAYLKEQVLSLTTIEFDLLSLLMKNPGVIYSPARLYEMLWGEKQWNDSQVVQLHLSGLRHKLEKISPEHSYIEVVWGCGYRFTGAAPLVSLAKEGGQDAKSD